MVPGVYNERRVYEHPIPVIDNEADQRSDPDEYDEDIEAANRSASPQVDSQLESRKIEDDANSFESPHVKAEVMISNRAIFEITEMLNDDDTKNEAADLLAASVWNHTEVIVPSQSGSASAGNVFDAPATSTRTITAIRIANYVKEKTITAAGSGLWTVDDVPTTSPGTVATAIDFDANVQNVVAHANGSTSAENDDDVTGTSNGPAAAIAINLNANGQGSVAHANESVGSGNATSIMPTKSTGAISSDADIEETVVTFYDSDDEVITRAGQ